MFFDCFMDLSKNYYLLLADIKDSSRLDARKRKSMFRKLDAALLQLNEQFSSELAIPLSLSYGDEIAGLLFQPIELYEMVDRLRDTLYPETTFRFTAVRGKISKASEDIRQVGGPVFKVANEWIVRNKKERRFSRWDLGIPERDRILNALTELSHLCITRMTDKQRRIYRLLKSGLGQKEIVKKLRTYQQSVSDAVKRGGADQVLEAEAAIEACLDALKTR